MPRIFGENAPTALAEDDFSFEASRAYGDRDDLGYIKNPALCKLELQRIPGVRVPGVDF